MSSPHPPHGNPADPPAEQPAWGQQPPGGWGQPQPPEQPEWDPDQTRAVDPRAWQQPQPPQGQSPQGRSDQQWAPQGQQYPPAQQPAYGNQPPYGGAPQQPYGAPNAGQYGGGQYGAPQPTQQYPAPAQGWGAQSPGGPATQQWGGGYPALPDAAPKGRSKLPLILGGVALLVVAAVAVLGFVTPGFFVTKVFDSAAVQTGVQKVLTDSYGLNVSSVTCGKGIQVAQGASFTCDATVDGASVTVPIRVTSKDGNYEVGRPN
jgi:Domain of unknown function (DUF4333)